MGDPGDEIALPDISYSFYNVVADLHRIKVLEKPLRSDMTIDPADYDVTVPNTLTLPSDGSTLALSVPAATEAGPGVLTITVTGTISDTASVK